jgi:glycosyltransferase involved in cell wall biosynthesis
MNPKTESVGHSLRVAVVSAVFPPEFTYSARTSGNIAEQLASDGHEVTVYASFPSKPAGRLFPGVRRKLYATTRERGYKLVRCFSLLAPESRILSRFAENTSFGLISALRLLMAAKPDVIYSNTWPIFATAMVAMVARLRRIPLVISVQDVYPECLSIQGRISGTSVAARVLRQIDRWNAHSAKELIVLSNRFRELYQDSREVPASHLHVIQNWGERSSIVIDEAACQACRRSHGIPENAFVLTYAGNIGPAAGVEGLLEAFAQVQDRKDLYLVIAGSGARLEPVQTMALRLKCGRLIFHTPWQEEETSTVLGSSDALLLPTIGTQSLVSVPSKIISYLLAARPVIACVLPQSETAWIVREASAGWVVDPDNPAMLANAFIQAANADRDQLRRMGEQAREYAAQNLSRESNLPRVLHLLYSAAHEGGPAAAGVEEYQ